MVIHRHGERNLGLLLADDIIVEVFLDLAGLRNIVQLLCRIRVVIAPSNYSQDNDTLYTDASGRFEKDQLKYSWPDELKNVTVRFEDVDGAENGSYQTKELKRSDIQVKQTDKGKGAWFAGSFTVTADAVLEKEDR